MYVPVYADGGYYDNDGKSVGSWRLSPFTCSQKPVYSERIELFPEITENRSAILIYKFMRMIRMDANLYDSYH
ncbi:MAG: hypothetical protein A2946_00600 [Candidatus Liptonbacteria bacterium RIFCSPLOWO2_01_FULL_53_13]|uniref:Uncharacterized protein n=1 Tax=Candidatus Liptonbacteria bacterium RIFCSPLOWO2_01_FULL_53_13 TaxID=1798651 RepID=A0A1G2CME8_9BACT|nr:MAG: hypothetical protein A2946_00600 [Candidatus Liptonbacteria bacterium RIFCSPLOWO2_01_FULL_53_13]